MRKGKKERKKERKNKTNRADLWADEESSKRILVEVTGSDVFDVNMSRGTLFEENYLAIIYGALDGRIEGFRKREVGKRDGERRRRRRGTEGGVLGEMGRDGGGEGRRRG